MKARTRSLLHETFQAGITLKGIDGVLEVIGGILIWFVTPTSLNRIAQILFQHELSRDPQDFIISHLLNASQNLTSGNRLFAALFLLSHGLAKIVLVIALWLNRLWAYPLIIVVFGAFSIYQIYRFTHTHSIWLALLTVFDVAMICLTWREYRDQKSLQARRGNK
jgi:uncharacterized membrane protein